MEKVVWGFMEPVVREHLTRKYVPSEPIDPLVYKVTAVYWLFQELVSNWKRGHRLTLDQKAKLLQLLVWNFARLQQEQAAYDEREFPRVETFTEDEICCECLDNAGETVPHPIDVALCETSDDDINISQDTTKQIAELVLSCKNFSKSQACDIE
jgi:hypothetical protein